MKQISVIGGGLAGLVAGISCAEGGARVHLYEAHATLGGNARATTAPYVAHDGPHVLYQNGAMWKWLRERDLTGPAVGVGFAEQRAGRFRHGGELRRLPPAAVLRMLVRRRRDAPVDLDFHSWMSERYGEGSARSAANLLGVLTFDADPGRLSAAFVWERLVRVFTAVAPPAVRFVIGGWPTIVTRLEKRARDMGVVIETGARIRELPPPPVIVATSLSAARLLLGDDSLRWESGNTVLLDLGLPAHRRDVFNTFDLDEAGFLERYSLPDPSLAPAGRSLVQAQMPIRPGETHTSATARLESLLDAALPHWRERVDWKRRGGANGRSGALDLPGTTWRDRPGIDRGGEVFLAGDMVAAPGLLSEVSWASARQAATAALAALDLDPLA